MKQLSPHQVVRLQCIECLGLIRWDRNEVENCKGNTCKTRQCPFFPYRLGKRISVKVFHFFCTHCFGGQSNFIAGCPSTSCKVYRFRLGKNPARQGKGGNFFQTTPEPIKTDRKSMIAGQSI
jgi:hypothetical protein